MAYTKPRQAKLPDYPQLSHEARPKHLGSTRSRLNEFIGGHFADDNLSTMMFHHQNSGDDYVQLQVWDAPGRSKPTFEEAKRAAYKPAKVGDSFGPSWTNHWFKVTIHIPSEWSEYERVQLEFDSTGEAMIYTTDGYPLHGLTGGYGGDRRVEFIIPEKERKAGVAHYFIEATCNKLGGQNDIHAPDDNQYYRLNSADLCVPNMEAWRLMWDFQTLKGVLDALPDDTPLAMRCLYVANEIMNVFVPTDPESIKKARKVAETILGEDWERIMDHESQEAEKQQGTLWGIGHCHIDTAWLWPFSVTQQKSARSWSTQLDLMNRYPEHRFSATQAQQFKWLEQLYPELFDKLKERVADGKFQPLGATWVEMDVNMPSGESLVRQFLYGQRYFESRFGFRSDTFVLPDTFGYSSQLPQIARSAGARNFFTQKLSWNHDNVFPHSTFNWVGLDSSQILTHMTPVDTYGAQANIDEIRRGMTNNKNLEVTSQALYLFGNGDGGGGPTPPMMEKLRRARAIGKRNDVGGQLPLVKMGGSFSEFYDSVRKETKNGTLLPNWRGELYGEFHRGTYTTQAKGKRENRRSEILMREAEYAATMASLVDFNYEYPKKKFDAAWEDILLCQFHDVLPGSGIAMIYEDAQNKYAAIRKSITAVIEEAYDVLYKSSRAVTPDQPIKEAGKLFALNTLHNYPRQAVVEVPIDIHPGLKTASAQISKNGQKGMILLDATDGAQPVIATPKGLYADVPRVTVSQAGYNTFTMANGNVAMTIRDGRIVSVYDKAHEKELIPEGMTGGMVIMEDHPNYWDAWDVDQFHLEKQTHLKFGQVHIAEDGPLRATLAATVQLGQSRMDVEISMDAIPASLKADARSLIRFHAVIDWREKHKFLKFELPLDISADNASYETQFGYLSRPTHRNTSWDNSKFEVCAHKYADLSEYGYGVAIINDCKYGYATEGNVMRLSLLRSPTEPDPTADQGTQEMSWAIYPHTGTLVESDVPQVAYAFNVPMQLRFAPALSDCLSTPHSAASPFKLVGAPNVQLETIKRAEDDDHSSTKATLIIRAFEQLGGHAKPTLKVSGLKIVKAELANILEDHVDDLKVTTSPELGFGGKIQSEIKLNFRGFEVKTVKLTVEKTTGGGGGGKGKGGGEEKTRRDSNASGSGSGSGVQNDGWIKL